MEFRSNEAICSWRESGTDTVGRQILAEIFFLKLTQFCKNPSV